MTSAISVGSPRRASGAAAFARPMTSCDLPSKYSGVAVGPGASEVRVGYRVVGTCVLPHGSFADAALMDSAVALPAPPGLGDAEAAGFVIAYQTGWFALHERARLREGETLLVHRRNPPPPNPPVHRTAAAESGDSA